MNDPLFYYSFSWQQRYDGWPGLQWLDEAESAITEQKLTESDFQQARDIINKIKNL